MQNATILGGVGGLSLTPDEAAFFREADPWGFILFGRNVDAPDQLRRLTGCVVWFPSITLPSKHKGQTVYRALFPPF